MVEMNLLMGLAMLLEIALLVAIGRNYRRQRKLEEEVKILKERFTDKWENETKEVSDTNGASMMQVADVVSIINKERTENEEKVTHSFGKEKEKLLNEVLTEVFG